MSAFKLKISTLKSRTAGFLKTYRAPLLSGVIIGTGYMPFPPWSALFMWVPLWWFILHQKSLKSVLMGAWLCQFSATLIGFNWVAFTIHTFGQMPWAMAIVGLLLFCAFGNLFIPLAGGAWFLLTKRSPVPLSVPAQLILLTVLFSLFHSLIPMLFPWHTGYIWLWSGLPAFQTAEIWGFRFLNTLLYVFNLCFLILYKHQWDSIGKKALLAVALLFVCLNAFGFYLKRRLPKPDSTLKVLLVQSNIGQLSRNQRAEQAWFTMKELTYRGLIRFRRQYKTRENIDFILWPEGTYPFRINKKDTQVPRVSRLIKRTKAPLVTGGTGRDHRGHSNSLFIFNREGELLKPVYDKMRLLAFGEYLPAPFRLPLIRRLFPYFQGRFVPGERIGLQKLENVLLGLQICYESLFDQGAVETARRGAHVLINVTNDSWYGAWQEPWQHLTLTAGRAVEVRRPLLRATNTGISTVIQSDGTLMKRSPLNKPWTQFYEIPYYSEPKSTLFMGYGFYINEVFLLLFSLMGFLWRRE